MMITYGDTPPSNLLTMRTATNSTLTARPLRGQMPLGGIRNQLPNSMMTGAVVGLPGVAPTGWSNTGSLAGIPREVTLVDNVNGRIRLKWSGTSGSTSTVIIRPSDLATIKAKVGQTWCWHYDIRLVSGSLDNITAITTAIVERDSGGSSAGGTQDAIEPGSSLMHVSQSRTLTNGVTVAVTPQIVLTPAGIGLPIDIEIELSALQFEMDTETAYQKVAALHDISQTGIDPVYHAYYDGGDDIFPQAITLPPISGGQILIASPNGIWIDDFDFAGGEWRCGPGTYTGGPSRIIASPVIGQRIMGIEIYAQPMTAVQRHDRIAYWMLRGAPGVWEVGPELVTNGDFAVDANWSKGAGWSIGGGVASCDGSQSAVSNITQNVGFTGTDLVLSEVTLTRSSGIVGWYIGHTHVSSLANVGGTTARRDVTQQDINGGTNFVIQGDSEYTGTADNISAKRLTLNTDPQP